MTTNIPVIETIEQARHFIGGRKAITKMNAHSLNRIKEEAKLNRSIANELQLTCTDPAQRMHYNGAIASKNAIVNRIDQLLKSKNL